VDSRYIHANEFGITLNYFIINGLLIMKLEKNNTRHRSVMATSKNINIPLFILLSLLLLLQSCNTTLDKKLAKEILHTQVSIAKNSKRKLSDLYPRAFESKVKDEVINHLFAVYDNNNKLVNSPINDLKKIFEHEAITDIYFVSHGWNYTLQEGLNNVLPHLKERNVDFHFMAYYNV